MAAARFVDARRPRPADDVSLANPGRGPVLSLVEQLNVTLR